MSKKSKIIAVLIVVVLLLAVVGYVGWRELFREEPQQLADDSVEEYFKYGSIGAEAENGLPYWIWLVLPKMFPEYLPAPGGYAGLGFPWEQGREMPVGFTKKTIGFERVAFNCAFCHTSQFRREGEVVSHIVPGGPGVTQDALAYQLFLFQCANDPRFNAGNVLAEIAQVTELSFVEKLIYRFILVPQTRKALLELEEQWTWVTEWPAWGKGRVSPFNAVRTPMLDLPRTDVPDTTDIMSVWNLGPRSEAGRYFHWDGLSNAVHEVVIISAFGDYATLETMPYDELQRLEEWFLTLPAPEFEDYFEIDRELAAAGQPIYAARCADCHSPGGSRWAEMLSLDDPAWQNELGDSRTDPGRAKVFDQPAADFFNELTDSDAFRATDGYINSDLDGVWLRAPYLHNGSVPSMAELLERPEERSAVFYRGHDVYDPERMGFVSHGPEAERVGTRYDVSLLGNSNQGHLWGTDLAAEEKAALIEYLKTL